jgi:hypothetical protein
LASSWITQRLPAGGGVADLLVLGVDPLPVVLDLDRGDFGRAKLAEERRKVALELPFVVLDRPCADRRVALARFQPVGGEFAEGRFLVAAALVCFVFAGSP